MKLGFGFSAGLFDYVLNFGHGDPAAAAAAGRAAYFAIYYATFRFCIVRFDLKTPGRDTETQKRRLAPATRASRGAAFVAALGGAANLVRSTPAPPGCGWSSTIRDRTTRGSNSSAPGA